MGFKKTTIDAVKALLKASHSNLTVTNSYAMNFQLLENLVQKVASTYITEDNFIKVNNTLDRTAYIPEVCDILFDDKYNVTQLFYILTFATIYNRRDIFYQAIAQINAYYQLKPTFTGEDGKDIVKEIINLAGKNMQDKLTKLYNKYILPKNVVYTDIPSMYTFKKEQQAGHTIIVNGNFNLKNYPLNKFPDIVDIDTDEILNGVDVEVTAIVGVNTGHTNYMNCAVVSDFRGEDWWKK